jgi:translation initiation factor 3 subunit B
MELPSRTELRQTNLFQVADLRMTWHDQGHFLCVKVDKHSKSKKTLNSAFELFRLRDKDVPIEVTEFTKDTTVLAFAWEPKGIRYAMIHGEAGSARTDVSFYTMGSKYNGRISLVKTLEKKACSTLWWSPAGNICLLANLKGTQGQLEWVDVNTCQTIGEAEHFMCSNIDWDPTGRFIATSVSHWRHQMENGFILWSSHGRELSHEKKDKFYQLLWRPRPKSLLSEAKEKDIRKNLRDYSKKYEEEDAKLKLSLDADMLKKRQEQYAMFMAFVEAKKKEYAADKPKRMALRGGYDSDDLEMEEFEEEEIEVLETKEEIEEGDEEIEIGDD